MTIAIENVTVYLGRDPEDFRRYAVTVQVCAPSRPEFKASTDLDPGKATTSQQLLLMVAAAGAACAEYLGDKYNEVLNPGECGQIAQKAFAEECRLQNEMAKGLPPLLKRLRQHASLVLSAEERELLHKIEWAHNNGEKLTPIEMHFISTAVARIHTSQLH